MYVLFFMQYNKFLAKSDDNYQKPPLKNVWDYFRFFFQAKVERFFNVSTLSSLISVEVQINVELGLFFMCVLGEKNV